jgi:hypothetical protein
LTKEAKKRVASIAFAGGDSEEEALASRSEAKKPKKVN